MKKLFYFFTATWFCWAFSSCQNKTVEQLSKRWDYVKMDNVNTTPQKFTSVEDSVAAVNMEAATKLLTWTFKKDKTYECAVGNKVATYGTYELSENDKVLTLTPSTKTNVRTYNINTLANGELVLSSVTDNVTVTLHFREH